MSAYIVYQPAKNNTEKLFCVCEDLDDAIATAKRLQAKYNAKGWDSWANKVKVRKPNNANAARELANELVNEGNGIDMFNQGGSYRGAGKSIAMGTMDALYHWADILRKAFPVE